MINADSSEVLEIPVIILVVSPGGIPGLDDIALPIHPSELLRLVHVEFKSHLHDPFHLAQFVVICPRGEWERPDLFRVGGFGLDRYFSCQISEFCVQLIGLRNISVESVDYHGSTYIELNVLPVYHNMAKHTSYSRAVH